MGKSLVSCFLTHGVDAVREAETLRRDGISAGLMPTEDGGNYLPEAPYLRETKTYLNYMHASESTLDSGTSAVA